MRNRVLTVLFLLVSVVSIASSASLKKKDLSEYLYLKEKPSDVYPIQEYKTDDKKANPDFLFSADYPYPRLVEFYAHWCPHCQHFKPIYIELGRKLRSVTQEMHLTTIETHAVSCVPNPKICSKLGIKGYPSVKLFPANSVNGTVVNISVLHPLQVRIVQYTTTTLIFVGHLYLSDLMLIHSIDIPTIGHFDRPIQ
jgi:thiol-disulfide isomerase/thioredoxin